jgi:hypothetical protein
MPQVERIAWIDQEVDQKARMIFKTWDKRMRTAETAAGIGSAHLLHLASLNKS